MKILMINSVCGIRSTGRICTDLADMLEKKGNIVKIAYGRVTVPKQYVKYAIKIGSSADVGIHLGMSLLWDCSGLLSKTPTEEFIRWVQEYDPDIIHLHNIHGFYMNINILFDYLKSCHKKIIWTLHDCWAFTGHCAYFDYSGCEKWKTCCKQCPSLKEYPPCFGVDQSKRNFELKKKLFTGLDNMVIVTPSQWLADLVKESFLAEYPVRVVHNDINHSVFHQNVKPAILPDNLKSKRIILGVASIWEKRKGLADFLALSKLISDEYQIVLVGLSKYQIKQLPENVTGITHTADAKELASLYAVADVFVNLTYEDNYPTTNLEAQACGAPVISYETGGSTESAREYGIVVKKGDLSAVASIINNKKYLECRDCRSNHAFLEEYANIYMNNHMDKERSVME